MTGDPSRYVIVGGGVAGLVTARRLAIAGESVTVLEAGDRFGGIVASHTVGGVVLDSGAESYATRGGTVEALATGLGLGPDIVTPLASPAWLYRADGVALPLPATSVLGIPGVPLAADVIAVVGLRSALRAQLDALLPAPYGLRSLTLGDLVRRRMGTGMLEKLVAPVVHGVHSAHPYELDVDRVAPFVRSAMRSEGSLTHAVRLLRERATAGSAIAGIRGGVHRLVTELLVDLQNLGVTLELGARVSSVVPGSVRVGRRTIRGSVIVAAAGVLEPNQARPITLATLVVDAPQLDAAPRGTGVLVTNGAVGVAARALTHSTAKWPWLAERTGGLHVLRLSYDSAPDDLAATALADAATLLGVDLPASSLVDHARVEWTRPSPESAAPDGLTSVGEAAGGTGLAAVVAHAESTAARLLEPS